MTFAVWLSAGSAGGTANTASLVGVFPTVVTVSCVVLKSVAVAVMVDVPDL